MILSPTEKDVALWMVEELSRNNVLDQSYAVLQIEKKFGSKFLYDNDNGNLAISKNVLKWFNRLTPNIVWSRGHSCWRLREESDYTGRMQD